MTRSAPLAAPATSTPRHRLVGASRRPLVGTFAVLALVASAGLGYLGWRGYQITKRIVGGTTVEQVTDPTSPGYMASVTPTPVHLLAVLDDEGRPRDFTVLVEGTGDEGGGDVLWVVGDLAIDTDAGKVPLEETYRSQGADAVRSMLEVIFGWGISDVTEVGPAEIASLVEPVGAVEIENPDPVRDEATGTTFAAGELTLEADEVADFLLARARGEAATNRGTRAELVWEALFEALGSSEDAAVAAGAEVLTDRGADLRAVTRNMARGAVGFRLLPVRDEPFGPTRLYVPDPERTPAALEVLVQAPVSAYPGQRPRTEIYNGTTDTDAARSLASAVSGAGAEVVAIGNATTLDREVTTVEFHDPAWAEAAARIAELFDVEATASADQTDGKDVTVVLGPGATTGAGT